jgi:hypothetical protein
VRESECAAELAVVRSSIESLGRELGGALTVPHSPARSAHEAEAEAKSAAAAAEIPIGSGQPGWEWAPPGRAGARRYAELEDSGEPKELVLPPEPAAGSPMESAGMRLGSLVQVRAVSKQ